MWFASSLCVSSRSSHGDLSILFCRPRLLLKAERKGRFSKSTNVIKIISAELSVVNHVTLNFCVNLSLSVHFYIVTISLFMISDSWQLEIHSDPWPFNYALGFTTVRNIIREAVQVLWNKLQPLHMPVPHETTWKKSAEGFFQKWNFPLWRWSHRWKACAGHSSSALRLPVLQLQTPFLDCPFGSCRRRWKISGGRRGQSRKL